MDVTRRMICRLVLCIGVLLALAAGGPAAGGEDEVVSVEIALEDGRLAVRDLLEAVCREAGIDPGTRLDGVGWMIDVGSPLGRSQLGFLERLAPGALSVDVQEDRVVFRIERGRLEAQGEELVRAIERWVLDTVGWRATDRRFGMSLVTPDDPRAPIDGLAPGVRRAVVLVHGLDDPGWIWRDLTLHLLDAGHVVLRFEYPNDQPIADSGDFFATHLRQLRAGGIERIDIVAHSMGGLVSRDVLTRRAYYNSDGSGRGEFPAVDRLIMLGTPNHGSVMARLRGVSQLREQASRLFSGDWSWREALADGAGEAGRDLLPSSAFLRRLNSRARPAHTRYTIVAGRLSPVSEDEIESLARRARDIRRSIDGKDQVGAGLATSWLKELVRGIGDGVVSIESARLEGVEDMVEVKGNHLSMIVDVFPGESTPPAIAIVLDRLSQPSREGTAGYTDG